MEKLRNYGSDPAEVPGARESVKTVADAWDFDKGTVSTAGIHLFHGRGEEQIDAFVLEERTVGHKGSRVASEVLVGPKLSWIDEDRCGHDVALLFCCANEREVAFM
jgi:hypothetical protein